MRQPRCCHRRSNSCSHQRWMLMMPLQLLLLLGVVLQATTASSAVAGAVVSTTTTTTTGPFFLRHSKERNRDLKMNKHHQDEEEEVAEELQQQQLEQPDDAAPSQSPTITAAPHNKHKRRKRRRKHRNKHNNSSNVSDETESVSQQQQQQTLEIDAKIVGGKSVSTQNDRSNFAFFSTVTLSSLSLCGASLVAPNVLLTAAHCQTSFAVGAKAWINSTNTKRTGRVLVNITQSIVHPNYVNWKQHDLMLLRIEPLATTSINATTAAESLKDIPFVRLDIMEQQQQQSDPTTAFTILGFGRTTNLYGSTAETLQQGTVHEVPALDCKQSYYSYMQPEEHICVWDNDNNTTANATTTTSSSSSGHVVVACSGDSGGPLLEPFVGSGSNSDRSNTQYRQVGVLSFGRNPCDSAPSVYIRLSGYRDFLRSTICQLSTTSSDSSSNSSTSTVAPPPAYLKCQEIFTTTGGSNTTTSDNETDSVASEPKGQGVDEEDVPEVQNNELPKDDEPEVLVQAPSPSNTPPTTPSPPIPPPVTTSKPATPPTAKPTTQPTTIGILASNSNWATCKLEWQSCLQYACCGNLVCNLNKRCRIPKVVSTTPNNNNNNNQFNDFKLSSSSNNNNVDNSFSKQRSSSHNDKDNQNIRVGVCKEGFKKCSNNGQCCSGHCTRNECEM